MNVIEFENVSKKYKIYYGARSFRNEVGDFFRKFYDKESLNKYNFYALNDVSFSVPKGTTLGILGSNGSGKSTILKLITKVAYPTIGSINIKGKVASLLELGAGFHPELTGRENIYLNASLLGLSKKQISNNFEEIVEFSELRKFIDTPIKKYSSGMYVRLGFSVAIHVNPEILLVDEVLSVGDINFQNKCIKKMREIVSDSTKTVIFVSHNMVTIQALCDKALWIEKGIFKAFDDTNKVLKLYSKDINKRHDISSENVERNNASSIFSSEIKVIGENGNEKNSFTQEIMTFQLFYKVINTINEKVIVTIIFEAVDLGLPIFSISTKGNYLVNTSEGEHILSCKVNLDRLYPREYSLRILITSDDMLINYDSWFDAARFYIIEKDDNSFFTGINNLIKANYEFFD